MFAIGGLSYRETWRLMPLRRLVRAEQLGGALDGLYCRLLWLRWRMQRGEMDEYVLDDETAERLRAGIMERIRNDAEV